MNSDQAQPVAVYALFRAVNAVVAEHFGGEAGGRLLLVDALDRRGSMLVLAANIAGVATLNVEADDVGGRDHIRNGVCDFLVNSLDEALRILKNEVRKKQAVSVCLTADWDATVAEIVERGVQPDLLHASIVPLEQRGAVVLPESQDLRPELGVTWTVSSDPTKWLLQLDALASASLQCDQASSKDDPRRRWIRLAPRYLRKALADRRYVGMVKQEADHFSALIQERIASGDLPDHVTMEWTP